MSKAKLNPQAQSLLDDYLASKKREGRRRAIQAALLFVFLNLSAFLTLFEVLKRSYDNELQGLGTRLAKLDEIRKNAVERLNKAEDSIAFTEGKIKGLDERIEQAHAVAENAGGLLVNIRATIGLDNPDQEERLQRLAELLAVVGPDEKLDLLRQIRELESAVDTLRSGAFETVRCSELVVDGGTLRIQNSEGIEALRLGVTEDGSGTLSACYGDGSPLARLGVTNELASVFSLFYWDGEDASEPAPRISLSARRLQGLARAWKREGADPSRWPLE